MINFDKIRTLVSELRAALNILYELKNLGKDAFLSDLHKVGSAKYNFIVIIEAAIDICHPIILKKGLRAPDDYADTFKVMYEAGAFTIELLKSLQAMARFRNRLVHLYWRINNEEVYKILQENLANVELFLEQLGKYLR